MTIRIHEVHPTLVHFPLTLVPMAFLVDLVGMLTGNRSLMRAGKRVMPFAAASGAVAGVAGMAAQRAVRVGSAQDLLTTHRNLNVLLVGAVGALAVMRQRDDRPGAGYLLGLAGVMAGMTYTAYLGGKMVYDHGVGVMPAGGVNEEADPEIRPGYLGEAATASIRNAREATVDSVKALREGSFAPTLRGSR
jgi:uncharacterized membrane protein